MADTARVKSTVYVGNLDNAVTASTLHAAFVPFGEIVDISLPKPEAPSSTDPHRGFGYVEFEEAGDAKEAMDNMDQSELYGRVIKVAPAKPQKEQNEGLGSRTAVWEQEGWLAKHAVSEEDRLATEKDRARSTSPPLDPMQGLEGLDVAGPKPE
ncbi:putative peptidyl prolyl cis-trans isomerase cyclophilin [Rhizodiscina lignyota]|uniref:Peptidyl prolyl cis-trans isomerase cyclophilin n=1 Tax=Rhizodiscina lignyota TaxID=1504668 RepID=A0A9P4IC17_9PEZI|nr:putative peptidyl prolyl cis-trans isomerase cyclophilin [Rhizodiscina lignyota]